MWVEEEQADMDKERARDLKRSGGTWLTPTKRQQRALSGHITPLSNNTNQPLSSPSPPSGSNNNITGSGEGGEGEERVKGLRWSSSNNDEDGGGGSEGEEGNIFRPPLTTPTSGSLSSRKRVKLRGKVSEDCNVAMDPAVVPRKLRSAINKRSSQSASPPLPDSKRKQLHASNGALVSTVYGAGRLKQNMLHGSISKEEEEVAEILTGFASLIPACKQFEIKEAGRMLEENSVTKTASASVSEASKEEGTKLLLPCVRTEATNPLSCVEESHKEPVKAFEPSSPKQPEDVSVTQKFDEVSNGTSQPHSHTSPILSNNENTENRTPLRNASNSSSLPGASPQLFSGNGILQLRELDAVSVRKPEITPWPFGSAPIEHNPRSVKLKPDSGPHHIYQDETTSDVRPSLLTCTNGQSTKSTSSKVAVCPDPATAMSRPGSNRKAMLTEKLLPLSTDRKQPKRCPTHVYITHLIQNYQNTEQKQRSLLPANQSKAKEGVSNEKGGRLRNGLIPAHPNGSLMDRNMQEARNRMLQDARLLQAQQNQGCDFLSLSAAGENKNPENVVKSSGQLHVPYMHPAFPHHSIMSFPFPRPPFNASSPYPDQLAAATAAAAQQVQLQLPAHYIGSSSSPFYAGPHMVHAATAKQQQQQQQIWQAQMAHYKPFLGFPKWQQNGKQQQHHHHDAMSPPSIFPPLPPPGAEMMQSGGAYHPPTSNPQQQHLLLPTQSMTSSSSSRAKQHQQHQQQQQQQRDSRGFSPDRPSQLQLLCNAQHT